MLFHLSLYPTNLTMINIKGLPRVDRTPHISINQEISQNQNKKGTTKVYSQKRNIKKCPPKNEYNDLFKTTSVQYRQPLCKIHIEAQSLCGALGGPHVRTHLWKSSNVFTWVATPVDVSTHVDTSVLSGVEASCVDSCVSSCVDTPVTQFTQVCPHV